MQRATRFVPGFDGWDENHHVEPNRRGLGYPGETELSRKDDAEGIGVQFNESDGRLEVSPSGRRGFVLHCVRLFGNGFYWFVPVGEKLMQLARALNQEVRTLQDARRVADALRLLRRKTPVLRTRTASGADAVIHPPPAEWSEVLDLLELLRTQETRALLKPPEQRMPLIPLPCNDE